MGSKVVQDSSLTLVADKIRSKTGSSGSINFPYGFVNQIDRLSLGGETPTGVRYIGLNGTYDVTGDASAVVNVQPTLGTMDITENGTYNVTDYSGATVNVPQGITPSGTKEITENGTFDVTNYASAIVSVEGGESESSYIIEEGEFEVFEDTTVIASSTSFEPYIIEHSLGKVPIDFRLWIDSTEVQLNTSTLSYANWQKQPFPYARGSNGCYRYQGQIYRMNSTSHSTSGVGYSANYLFDEEPTESTEGFLVATDEEILVGNQLTDKTYILRSGCIYKWYAIAERD